MTPSTSARRRRLPLYRCAIRTLANLSSTFLCSSILALISRCCLEVRSERLGVPTELDAQYELMGFDGSKSFAPAVRLEMILLKRTFRGRFLLVDQEQGILGRDILNHLRLVLAGPTQQWWEYSP